MGLSSLLGLLSQHELVNLGPGISQSSSWAGWIAGRIHGGGGRLWHGRTPKGSINHGLAIIVKQPGNVLAVSLELERNRVAGSVMRLLLNLAIEVQGERIAKMIHSGKEWNLPTRM